jgi:hypothetical protein
MFEKKLRIKYILLYKFQQDEHITEIILSDNCSTYFWRYYHLSSGAQTTLTTASGNRYTVLLSAVIVKVLELVCACCGWRRHQQHAQTGSNSSTLAADNNTV